MMKDCTSTERRFKICVLTTTRADYGILRPLLCRLFQDQQIDLRIAVSGTHLSNLFGMTVQEIEADGFSIDAKLSILEGCDDTPMGMADVMAHALAQFSAYFHTRSPDLLVVLGDRFEVFAICAAAVSACIPIAHIHGGEATEGLMDECFRHSITKMSYLHFTATEVYRKRVIQLGEEPDRVFNVGAMGVENALHVHFLSPEQIEADLDFPLFQRPYVVITFHPVTLEESMREAQMNELLLAIEHRSDLNFLITESNADIGGQHINACWRSFAANHSNCCVVSSLGVQRYMSVIKYAVCAMGNSSSGIIESPSLGIPTINIGDRQRGRVQADSVINCAPFKRDILQALELACSEPFRKKAALVKNPYGDGSSSERIYHILKTTLSTTQLDLKKSFYDIDFSV